jgi:hypothetical protein
MRTTDGETADRHDMANSRFRNCFAKAPKKEHLMWRSCLSTCDTVSVSKHMDESLEVSILETFTKCC